MAATVVAHQQPTVETITPAAAKRLLAVNGHNRSLRQAWVDKLASMMSNGEWLVTGDTIKIAEDGMLLDGQHRLAAAAQAGIELEAIVVRGLPLDAQDTVDLGRGRRLADMLAIEGHKDPHALAAAINFLYRYKRRQGKRIDNSRSSAPTPQQALALLEEAPGLRESVRIARAVTAETGGPLGVFAGLHSEFEQVDPVATSQFFARLESGLELQKGDPVWHLRRHILRPRRDRHYAQAPHYVAALTIKAFNYRRAGKKIDLLSFRANEQFPTLADDVDEPRIQ